MRKIVASFRSGVMRTSGTVTTMPSKAGVVDLAALEDVRQRVADQFADAQLALGGRGRRE